MPPDPEIRSGSRQASRGLTLGPGSRGSRVRPLSLLTRWHDVPNAPQCAMKNYKSRYSIARGLFILGSSLQLRLGSVGCSNQPASTTEDGVESASVFLTTTVTPSDVKCLVLNASAAGSTVTRSFDVTPSQAASLTATGLPTGTVTLTEGAYNAACSQVTVQTPLTWVSDAAVVVQLGAGQTTPVSIVLRRAGEAVISTSFADNVDGGTPLDGGTPVNNPPTIAAAASANPNPVTGSTTALSVLGADDNGEASLTYTWTTTGTPPASVSFSANGTNGAKNTTATFTAAGTYSFQVTVKDQGNLTVASAVTLTVNRTLTSIVVTPASTTVSASAAQQFTATARDQFATNLPSQPTFTWTVSGGGTVSASGLFTAGTSAGGPYALQATSGGITGTATITVASAPTPVAVYRIDTGSSSAVSPFTADAYATGGTTNATTNTISTTGVTNAAPAAVYQSERYGNSAYTLPSLVASAQYTVRLHFAEIYWTASGKRIFNVLINGTTVLSSFDIFAVAGGQYKAVVRDFTATANASGQIVIQFNTVTDNATIEGIEVLSTGVCSPGATQCSGNNVQTCSSSGTWGTTAACSTSQVCSNGACTSACTPGATQCSGNGVQTCSSSGTWGTTAACSTSQVCSNGACTSACTPGATQCSGNGVQTCSSSGTWGTTAACSTNQVCSNGACTGVCTPGATQCSGNGVQTCSSSGTWGTPAACTNQVCLSGACTGVCTPGATQCSGNGVQICSSSGTWGTPVTCMNQVCLNGTCTGVCTPGATQCSGNGVQTCSSSGTWGIPAACTNQACVGGACTGVCTSGATQCAGTTPQTCNSQGTWINGTITPGQCGAVCTPNTDKTCSGNTVLTCDLTGKWPTSGTVCPYVCSGGACGGSCVPGTTQCAPGNAYQTCSSTGSWGSSIACTNQTCVATTGTCTGVCAPGATQCSGTTPQTCNAGAWVNGTITPGQCGAL